MMWDIEGWLVGGKFLFLLHQLDIVMSMCYKGPQQSSCHHEGSSSRTKVVHWGLHNSRMEGSWPLMALRGHCVNNPRAPASGPLETWDNRASILLKPPESGLSVTCSWKSKHTNLSYNPFPPSDRSCSFRVLCFRELSVPALRAHVSCEDTEQKGEGKTGDSAAAVSLRQDPTAHHTKQEGLTR